MDYVNFNNIVIDFVHNLWVLTQFAVLFTLT
jgi:hypothetical protein